MEELNFELIEKIMTTQNKNLLLLVKDDIDFYSNETEQNKLGLSEDDYDELTELAAEPAEKDTTTFESLKIQCSKGI